MVKNGKTYSTVEHLSGETRLEEIADMIRGNEKTDITRKQAEEMLRDAKRKAKKQGLGEGFLGLTFSRLERTVGRIHTFSTV